MVNYKSVSEGFLQFNGVVFSNQSKWAKCFEDTALLFVVGSCV